MADRLPDPRDELNDCAEALWGIVGLLTMCDEPVDRRGIEHLLRLIGERLSPARDALQEYVPRD